jgi:signal transduction histidine kinase
MQRYPRSLWHIVVYAAVLLVGEAVYQSALELWSYFSDQPLSVTSGMSAGSAIVMTAICVDPVRYYVFRAVARWCPGSDTVHGRSAYRELLSDISHNIQTPLAIAQGELELLGIDRAATARQALTKVSTIIGRLTKLAVLEEETKESVDFSLIVKEEIEYVRLVAQEEGVRIDADIDPNIYIYGNAGLLQEMLLNILHNAMKYRTSDKPTISIRLHACDTIELTVRDNGLGIAAEHIPHVFKRFYRSSTVRDKYPGDGLGLAFVERVVAVHQGTISLTSELGVGTQIVLRFSRLVHR